MKCRGFRILQQIEVFLVVILMMRTMALRMRNYLIVILFEHHQPEKGPPETSSQEINGTRTITGTRIEAIIRTQQRELRVDALPMIALKSLVFNDLTIEDLSLTSRRRMNLILSLLQMILCHRLDMHLGMLSPLPRPLLLLPFPLSFLHYYLP